MNPKVYHSSYFDLNMSNIITDKKPEQKSGSLKPNGIWYSNYNSKYGSDWLEFCHLEMGGSNSYLFELTFIENVRILELISPQELIDLVRKHRELKFPSDLPIMQFDWVEFAKRYDIIDFRNVRQYRHERPEQLLWYSLDVDSGVIMDTNVIKSIKKIKL